jgi:hypothetical protein
VSRTEEFEQGLDIFMSIFKGVMVTGKPSASGVRAAIAKLVEGADEQQVKGFCAALAAACSVSMPPSVTRPRSRIPAKRAKRRRPPRRVTP